MRIKSLRADLFRVPVELPLLSKTYLKEQVLVRIETDNGIIGYGMTADSMNRAVKEFINSEVAPVLNGENPIENERIWQKLFKIFNVRALTGVWSSAISAVDIGLWDIKGKYFGESVSRLLGGAASRVPAYITCGVHEYDRDQLVEIATTLVKEGNKRLKVVLALDNGANINEDIARVKAVREAVGDDVDLMVDANCRFSYSEALNICKRIEPYNIFWFEEPLWVNDYLLLKQLKQQTRIPLAAGQHLGHLWHHRDLIVNNAVDISQPNVLFVGGYTEAVKVANLARAFNLPIANGEGWPHHNIHLQAAVPNGSMLELHFFMWKVGELLFNYPLRPKDGWVDLPAGPGLGFQPTKEAIKDFCVVD